MRDKKNTRPLGYEMEKNDTGNPLAEGELKTQTPGQAGRYPSTTATTMPRKRQ